MKISARVALLCLMLLVALCGSANALNFGNIVKDVANSTANAVKTAVNSATAKGLANKATFKAEEVVKDDLNKDGQTGKFRSQAEEADGRQVNGDPNAKARFQIIRPRSGRALSSEEQAEPMAAPAPMLHE